MTLEVVVQVLYTTGHRVMFVIYTKRISN